MSTTTIVINFPSWPNETVIVTEQVEGLPPVVYIDGHSLSEEQKRSLLEARAALLNEIRMSFLKDVPI